MSRFDEALMTKILAPGWIGDALLWRTVADGDCLLWDRTLNGSGYAPVTLMIDGALRSYMAHRLAWAASSGRPPAAGAQIDHTCNRRACVNPDHLREVTASENTRLVAARQREHEGAVLATSGTVRVRTDAAGRERHQVMFRDRADGRVYQRSRTFDSADEAQRFLAALGQRDLADLVA